MMKKLFALLLTASLVCSLLAGCEEAGRPQPESAERSDLSAEPATVDFYQSEADLISERDRNAGYNAGKSILVQLNGTSATANAESVRISGSTVTVTEEATYIFRGSLTDGRIIVDAPKTAKLQLVLNGAAIHCETAAPLCIREADKVFVTLAEGSENTLSNGGSFTSATESGEDAAVFSAQDLSFNGSGSLTVASPAGNGITCKDHLVFTGGSFAINAASHGLDANDSLRITDATDLTIDAGKDGIHCENADDPTLGFVYIANGTVKIEAEGDGIAAGATMQIENGSFDLLIGGGSANGTQASSDSYGGFMGGGRPQQPPAFRATATTEESGASMKGIKAASSMLISGGTFRIDSADDSVHADQSVVINGGSFTIASGDDAIHAEETLTVTAGAIQVTKCYEGLEALNIDLRGGEISLIATDDGLNAAGGNDESGTTGGRDGMFGPPGGMGGGKPSAGNGSITISGGKLSVQASGDGLDANGTLTISGGYTVVAGPSRGDTATLDYDGSGSITGGIFIGTGASGMAQTFSDSAQGVVAVNIGNQSAGTELTLSDPDGDPVLSCVPELPFSVAIFSSPELVSGETYTLSVGSESMELTAN